MLTTTSPTTSLLPRSMLVIDSAEHVVRRKESMNAERLGLTARALDATYCLYRGLLPSSLDSSPLQARELWKRHPATYHEIELHGRLVKTPRWQQAYGEDYYTKTIKKALPMLPMLQPLLPWGGL